MWGLKPGRTGTILGVDHDFMGSYILAELSSLINLNMEVTILDDSDIYHRSKLFGCHMVGDERVNNITSDFREKIAIHSIVLRNQGISSIGSLPVAPAVG